MLLEDCALVVPSGSVRDRICGEAERAAENEWNLDPDYCIAKKWAIVRLPREDFTGKADKISSGLIAHGYDRVYGFRVFEPRENLVYNLQVSEHLFVDLVIHSAIPDWLLMSTCISFAMNQSTGDDYWDFGGPPDLLEACIGDIDLALAEFEADIDCMAEKPEFIAELREQAARNRRICELARRARA